IVADSGVIGENGEALQFLTNADGSIGGIRMPDGSRLIYLYDRLGRLVFAGGSHVGEPTNYAYENGSAGRLTGSVGMVDRGFDYDADGLMTQRPIARHMGTLAQAAASPASLDVTAGRKIS